MNKIQSIFIGIASLTCFCLSADNITSFTFDDSNQGWNSHQLANMYFHHSETQRQWAWEILGDFSFSGDERVLDFGSGDGKISAEMSRMVKNGSVVGAEVSNAMLNIAQTYFPNHIYPNLEFKKSDSLTFEAFPLDEGFDIITAFSVFHLVTSPGEVLKNLKSHLKPTGKLLLTIPTGNNPALYAAAEMIFPKYGLSTPWSQKLPSLAPSMRTTEGCHQLLQAAGFRIESIRIIETDNPFYDLDDFIIWLVGTATATWRIPMEISLQFFTDLVECMQKLDPSIVDNEGHARFRMPRIHVIATPEQA